MEFKIQTCFGVSTGHTACSAYSALLGVEGIYLVPHRGSGKVIQGVILLSMVSMSWESSISSSVMVTGFFNDVNLSTGRQGCASPLERKWLGIELVKTPVIGRGGGESLDSLEKKVYIDLVNEGKISGKEL